MCLKFILAILSFASVVLLLTVFIIGYPKLNEISNERSIFLDNQDQFYDMWDSQPMWQKQKFYFYNITNGKESFDSDSLIAVDEVGPFVYESTNAQLTDFQWERFDSMNALNLKDMNFILSESVADESAVIRTLNIPLIRKAHLIKIGKEVNDTPSDISSKDFVCKTTVRDILSEVIDGYSLKRLATEESEEIFKFNLEMDSQRILKDLQNDSSSNYLSYLRNELCLRLFGVSRFVNSPVYKNGSLSRIFEKLPCNCLTFIPNGTEEIHRTRPETFSIRTKKYLFLWNESACPENQNISFIPLHSNLYIHENLFSISSRTFWDHNDYDSDHLSSKIESPSPKSQINVEPITEVITDFNYNYQHNIPVKFVDEQAEFENTSVKIYPILLTEISGRSVTEIDFSIYHYIIFPKIFITYIGPKILYLMICVSLTVTIAIFMWILSKQRREAEANETTSLLDPASEEAGF